MLPAPRRRALSRWSDPFDYVPLAFSRMLEPWRGTVLPEDLPRGEYPVDVNEDDKNVYVDAEMPGFKKDEIEVRLDGNELHIMAERESEPPKGTRHLNERRYARVERLLTLPAAVDPQQVDAKLEDGVLRMKMEKSRETEQSRIEIK